MNKKIIIVLVALAILLVPVTASAKSDKDKVAEKAVAAAVHKANVAQAKQTRLAAKVQKQIAKMKKLGNKLINKDVKHLGKLMVKTDAKTTLSADQKTSLNTQLQAEKTALATLSAKIYADTDLNTMKADIASIPTVGSLNGKYLPLINAPAVITP